MSMFDKRKDNEPAREPVSTAPAPDESPRTPETGSRGIAMIGSSITIKGDVTGDESLVINGKVEGAVMLKSNDLTVGQSGEVQANVTARVVRVEGQVTGDITGIEKVVITKTGRVLGNVTAPRVNLEDGSKFKGSIDMDPGPAQQAAAPQSLKSVPPGNGPAAETQPGKGVGNA